MRKFWREKIWSHGTPLGSLGPLSREAPILGAVQLQILVIWGPYELLVVVVLETQAKNFSKTQKFNSPALPKKVTIKTPWATPISMNANFRMRVT